MLPARILTQVAAKLYNASPKKCRHLDCKKTFDNVA